MTSFAPPSTDYWSVTDLNGVDQPLQSYAYNIVTWGGDRQSVPPVRGANVVIPWVPGQVFVPKLPDSRTITLAMWVIGANPDGSVPALGTSQRNLFVQNWNMIRSLLWGRQEQFTLTKRFFDVNGVLQTATAQAEFADGLSLSMTGATRGEFTVDLLLADPFFYGTPVDIPFDSSGVLGNASYVGPVLGDYYVRDITITATADTTAGVINPTVSVPTTTPASVFSMTTNAAPGTTILVNSSAQYCLIGNQISSPVVTHTGYRDWITLNNGPNCEIDFSGAGGAWNGTLTYTPVYL